MLGTSTLHAFVATTDLATARSFYETTLGLRVVDDDGFALVLDSNGTTLRVTRAPAVHPAPYTVLGWEVVDIASAVTELADRGIAFHRYDGMDQDASGVWTAPGGDRVAWFSDPAGNTLSVSQPGVR